MKEKSLKLIAMISVLGALSTMCGAARATTDKYNITPQEHAACDGDAERLCLSAYPDEDKMISCMESRRKELTPLCTSVFDAGLKKRHLKT